MKQLQIFTRLHSTSTKYFQIKIKLSKCHQNEILNSLVKYNEIMEYFFLWRKQNSVLSQRSIIQQMSLKTVHFCDFVPKSPCQEAAKITWRCLRVSDLRKNTLNICNQKVSSKSGWAVPDRRSFFMVLPNQIFDKVAGY